MKKLMFVAAVAAGLAALGDGNGIESANTVGYYESESAFRTGNTMYTPMFAGVGDAEYSIQDIKPVGTTVPNGSSSANAITLQKLNAQGGIDGKLYYWMDYYDDDEEEDEYGWRLPALFTAANITFKAGEAFWLKMPTSANCTLQFNGEVRKGNSYILLRQGNTAVGNPNPVTINVADIRPVGDNIPNGSSSANAITLQKLNASGGIDGKLYYWMDYYDDDEEEDEYGWRLPALFTACTMTLAPGEGIWVKCPNATTSLQFPAAIAE